jgi:hypothetical protein
MFEQKRSGKWNFSWAGIVLVVIFVLTVFWFFRQNPPEASGTVERKTIWTTGEIVSGPLEVEAGGVLTFPMNLNKRSALDATFFTGDSRKRLVMVIVNAADLEKWKAGEDVKVITNTGTVPRGIVKRVMDPGEYVIVLDNRMNQETMRIPESEISVQ